MCDRCNFIFIDDDRPTRQELEAEAAYEKWAASVCDDCGERMPYCNCPPGDDDLTAPE